MLLGQVRRATKVSSGLRKASAFLVCLAPLFDMLCSLQCNCSCMNPFKKENLQLHEHEWKGRRKGPSIDSPFGQTVPVPSWVRKAPLELVSLVWFGVKFFPNITVNGACCFAPHSFAVLWSYIIDHQQVNMLIIVQQLPYGLSNNLSHFFSSFSFILAFKQTLMPKDPVWCMQCQFPWIACYIGTTNDSATIIIVFFRTCKSFAHLDLTEC